MAKAVMPMAAFRQRFGNLQGDELNEKVLDLALQFLHEHAPAERRREPAAAAVSSRP
jgi:hypothetical protein